MNSFLGWTCESIIMSHCRSSDTCKVGSSHQLQQSGSRLPVSEDEILAKVLTSASSSFSRVMDSQEFDDSIQRAKFVLLI